MTIPEFNFNTHPNGTFDIPAGGLPVRINIEEGTLEIGEQDELLATFPLIEDGAPKEQSLLIKATGNGQLLVGTADFQGAPLFLREFSVNTGDSSVSFKVSLGGGFIGSVDIRDVFRQIQIRYDFSDVPITLSRTGDFLRITTVRCESDGDGECWYVQDEI